MVVLIINIVNRCALSTFTIMIDQIQFSITKYGKGGLWRVWEVKGINAK